MRSTRHRNALTTICPLQKWLESRQKWQINEIGKAQFRNTTHPCVFQTGKEGTLVDCWYLWSDAYLGWRRGVTDLSSLKSFASVNQFDQTTSFGPHLLKYFRFVTWLIGKLVVYLRFKCMEEARWINYFWKKPPSFFLKGK